MSDRYKTFIVFSQVKKIKKALEKTGIQKYQVSSSPHLQNQQRTQQLQQAPPKVIKKMNLIQQQQNNFHQRQLKRNSILNSQYLKYPISRKRLKCLSMKIKKQETYYSLDKIIQRLQLLIKKGSSKRIQAYWNIQTEHRQEITRLGNIAQKQEFELSNQKNISANITNQTNQIEIEQKKLQIEKQLDKQGRNATTIVVSDICTRVANILEFQEKFWRKVQEKFQRFYCNQHEDIYRRKRCQVPFEIIRTRNKRN